jgi:hypothetical protein
MAPIILVLLLSAGLLALLSLWAVFEHLSDAAD